MPEWIHLANSSALDEGSTTEWMQRIAEDIDARRVLVRPGLALYGYCLQIENENGGGLPRSPTRANSVARLQPVLTWKTRILATREIAAGPDGWLRRDVCR